MSTNKGFGIYSYPVGTKVNATVESIEPHGVGYKFWVNDKYWIGFISDNHLDVLGVKYSFYLLYSIYETIADNNYGYMVNYTFYQICPFFDLQDNDYISSPDQLAQDINNTFPKYLYPNIECKNYFTIREDEVYFESWVGGEVNTNFGYAINRKENYPSDISFGNNFHFAINPTTGVVYGFGRRGWAVGTINDTKVKVSFSSEYELEGYHLPKYTFGSYRNFLNTELIIVLSSVIPSVVILAIGTTFFIIYYRKRHIKTSTRESEGNEYDKEF